jgi:hypothetical protein
VHGRLTRDELDLRVGRALAARTYADLGALTADIPPAPAAARPARRPAPARRRPLARTAAISGTCLIIAPAAFVVGAHFDPFSAWRGVMFTLAVCTLWTAIGTMGYALFIAWDQKSPRRPPPSRPGRQALQAEQCSSIGRGSGVPAPRTDQSRADLRAHSSRQRPRHLRIGTGRAPRSLGLTPGAV